MPICACGLTSGYRWDLGQGSGECAVMCGAQCSAAPFDTLVASVKRDSVRFLPRRSGLLRLLPQPYLPTSSMLLVLSIAKLPTAPLQLATLPMMALLDASTPQVIPQVERSVAVAITAANALAH